MSEIRAAGFLNVNKPLNLTSHDVVARVRHRYRSLTGFKKVGHAGALDPLADGVLVICLGAATRLSEYVMRGRKVYRAQVTFGAVTTTYDAAGETVERGNADHVSLGDIERALPGFIGEIEQAPPMYSAIKVDGQKLYELARQGKTIRREKRAITIHAIAILSWRRPVLALEIECESGTYIRSLAHDLGAALGCGGYLSGLTRAASGGFRLEDSLALDAISEDGAWLEQVAPPYDALTDYPRVQLGADDIERLRFGRFISRPPDFDDAAVFAFDARRRLVAVLEPRAKLWKPRKVFLSPSI